MCRALSGPGVCKGVGGLPAALAVGSEEKSCGREGRGRWVGRQLFKNNPASSWTLAARRRAAHGLAAPVPLSPRLWRHASVAIGSVGL